MGKRPEYSIRVDSRSVRACHVRFHGEDEELRDVLRQLSAAGLVPCVTRIGGGETIRWYAVCPLLALLLLVLTLHDVVVQTDRVDEYIVWERRSTIESLFDQPGSYRYVCDEDGEILQEGGLRHHQADGVWRVWMKQQQRYGTVEFVNGFVKWTGASSPTPNTAWYVPWQLDPRLIESTAIATEDANRKNINDVKTTTLLSCCTRTHEAVQ